MTAETNSVLTFTRARLSFPKLIEATVNPMNPAGDKKFGCDLIISPHSEEMQRFMAAVNQAVTNKWREAAPAVVAIYKADRKKRCFGQGNEKINGKTMKVYDGYEDMAYITCSSNEDKPPIMIRANGSTVDNANTMERAVHARKLYGGCYVNAAVSIWLQDNQFGKAVRCNILAIQFAKDGEPFGEGAPDLTGAFGAVATDPKDVPAPDWM
jgi:hypothetical protein